jgi:hypothetical protein
MTWEISQLNCKPSEGEYSDVVVTAHWRCTGVDENYTASVYSTCSFPAPEGDFTPYEDLTLDQVLGWCWANGVDKDATEAAVQTQIDAQINPPIVSPALPWAQGASA